MKVDKVKRSRRKPTGFVPLNSVIWLCALTICVLSSRSASATADGKVYRNSNHGVYLRKRIAPGTPQEEFFDPYSLNDGARRILDVFANNDAAHNIGDQHIGKALGLSERKGELAQHRLVELAITNLRENGIILAQDAAGEKWGLSINHLSKPDLIFVDEHTAGFQPIRFDPKARIVDVEGEFAPLSDTSALILNRLVDEDGTPVSHQELATLVGSSEETVLHQLAQLQTELYEGGAYVQTDIVDGGLASRATNVEKSVIAPTDALSSFNTTEEHHDAPAEDGGRTDPFYIYRLNGQRLTERLPDYLQDMLLYASLILSPNRQHSRQEFKISDLWAKSYEEFFVNELSEIQVGDLRVDKLISADIFDLAPDGSWDMHWDDFEAQSPPTKWENVSNGVQQRFWSKVKNAITALVDEGNLSADDFSIEALHGGDDS